MLLTNCCKAGGGGSAQATGACKLDGRWVSGNSDLQASALCLIWFLKRCSAQARRGGMSRWLPAGAWCAWTRSTARRRLCRAR